MESRRPDPAARSCRLLGGGALLAALALGAGAPCAQAAEAPTRPFVVEGEALVRGARASEGTVKLESMRDHGDGWSGWAQLRWRPFGEGQTLGLVLVAPADGTYRVDAAWTRGPDAGDVRVSVRGRMFEPTLEGWSPRVDLAGPVRLGEVNLVRGANDVEIRVVGHDVRSNGYRFGLDRLVLTPLGASGAEPGAAEVAPPVEPSPEAEGPTSEPPRPARTGPVAVPPPPVPPNPPGTAPPPGVATPGVATPGVATPGDDAPLPPGPLPGDPAGPEPLPTFDEGTPTESLPPPETMPPRPEPAAPDAPPPTPGERETPAAAPCGVMGQAAACDEETAPVVDPDAEVPVAEPPAGAADVPPAAPPLHTAPAGTEPPAAPDVTAPEVVEPAAPTPARGPTPPAPGSARAPQPSQPVGPPPRPAPAPAPDAGTTPAAPAPAPAPGPAEPEVAPKPPVEAPPPGPTPADRRLLFEAVQGLERYFEGKPRGAGWAKALKLAEVREAMAAKLPDDAVATALARRLDKFPPGPAYEALLAEPAFVRLTRALAPFRTSDDDSDDWSTADR